MADAQGTGSALSYDLIMSIQNATMAYSYRGIPTWKNPFDLAIYPQLLAALQPRTLIEIGSHQGGSALWFADTAKNLDLSMHVYSIDVAPVRDLLHPDISFLEGDARQLDNVLKDDLLRELPRPWLVVEDADHSRLSTLAVLQFFDRWLRPGEYIVVEDGILSAMGVAESYDGGPLGAIGEFLQTQAGRYSVDRHYCDYFGHNVTWNFDGYLRREAGA